MQEWAPDPYGRHELRWWDGRAWTEHVSDAGVQGVDPIAPPPPPPQATPRHLTRAGAHGHATGSPRAVRPGLGLGTHVLLTVLTCGLWLFAAPAWYLWRHGNRQAAGAWAGAVGVLAIIGAVFGGGSTNTPQAVEFASVPTEQVAPAAEGQTPTPEATTKTATPPKTSKTTPAKAGAKKSSTTKRSSSTRKKPTTATKTTIRKPRTTAPTTTKRKPKPTPTTGRQQGITPGAFCSPEGALGVSKKGKPYVCRPKTPGDQARWLPV